MPNRTRNTLSSLLVLALAWAGAPAWAGEGIRVTLRPDGIAVDVAADNEGVRLSATGPKGFKADETLGTGRGAYFFSTNRLRDGQFRFEVRLDPVIDAEARRELAVARERGNGDEVFWRLCEEGRVPLEVVKTSGYFSIVDGRVLPDDLPEEGGRRITADPSGSQVGEMSSARAASGLEQVLSADQVIPDDLIVQGSTCVGFDCVNNESFGFDTIRLKENNLRIKFEDTSVGSFPTNDWQLVANDSASGGASRFSIEDVTGSRVPFTVEAAASTNSLFVDSTGRIGFRTSTPVLDLHVKTSNTPGMRLEQDSSGGFTAQTWDVAGNEANFFVRDVTGGSRLSFRIRPGAPTSSIDIAADGDVGIGTASPAASLHVRRTNGTALVEIEEASASEAAREMLSLTNNGRINWRLTDTSANGQDLTLRLAEDDFDISFSAVAGDEFTLNQNGNLVIAGTLTENSDRDKKTNIVPVDPAEVLAKVNALPIARWTYKLDDPNVAHLGPMAQDFYALFGLGADERHIATIDTSGVALAAIQALHGMFEKNQEALRANQEALAAKQRELEALKSFNGDLLQRLEALEAKIQ